jgi:hypothetical protein
MSSAAHGDQMGFLEEDNMSASDRVALVFEVIEQFRIPSPAVSCRLRVDPRRDRLSPPVPAKKITIFDLSPHGNLLVFPLVAVLEEVLPGLRGPGSRLVRTPPEFFANYVGSGGGLVHPELVEPGSNQVLCNTQGSKKYLGGAANRTPDRL